MVSRSRWDNRIERARQLCNQSAASAELLRFYEAVLRFQGRVAEADRSKLDIRTPLRQQINVDFVSLRVPDLLALTIKQGPSTMSLHARKLREQGETSWRTILKARVDNHSASFGPDDFVALSCFQPIAENLQSQLAAQLNYAGNRCEACGGLPLLAIFRPEGDGGKRSLLCSFCLREWLFRRIVCPWCGEEDKNKLPHYSAEEYSHLHVEACDTCKRYLKAVDMTIDGRAEPLVDEAAAAALDLWAADHGYAKIVRNLIGF
jgi:FdhE protein